MDRYAFLFYLYWFYRFIKLDVHDKIFDLPVLLNLLGENQKNLLGKDILLNLGIEVLQKQAPPTVLDVEKTPSKPPVGIEVNQIKFELDRKPCQMSTHQLNVCSNCIYQFDSLIS